MSVSTLLDKQNPDGGWPYTKGRSWTEPTAYAVLALLSARLKDAASRGVAWILSNRRPDGGWAPEPAVDESTWVTSLVALLPPDSLGPEAHLGAINWLLTVTGEESGSTYRLRQWLLGNSRPADQRNPGWPWVPGAAAWVGPTALAILALEQESRRNPSAVIQRRLADGRAFLLARMCQEGGWNHGSSRAAGYESRPYPETTGMALAALRGVVSPKIDRALDTASRFLAECRSADAQNWLTLGLAAHGRLSQDFRPSPDVRCRTLPDTSLALLVNAGERGRAFLLG